MSDRRQGDSLAQVLRLFAHMYRPHAAREDTVLFPSLRSIVSGHEFDALGEEFEEREHQLFGPDGFEAVVGRVAALEDRLGISDLASFTASWPAV
jgi:hemerythrin-like domain-containing protein